jgi:hypothetical protein
VCSRSQQAMRSSGPLFVHIYALSCSTKLLSTKNPTHWQYLSLCKGSGTAALVFTLFQQQQGQSWAKSVLACFQVQPGLAGRVSYTCACQHTAVRECCANSSGTVASTHKAEAGPRLGQVRAHLLTYMTRNPVPASLSNVLIFYKGCGWVQGLRHSSKA